MSKGVGDGAAAVAMLVVGIAGMFVVGYGVWWLTGTVVSDVCLSVRALVHPPIDGPSSRPPSLPHPLLHLSLHLSLHRPSTYHPHRVIILQVRVITVLAGWVL